MGVAERSPVLCADTHEPKCVKQSQEQVMVTSWRVSFPLDSMVVSTKPDLSSSFCEGMVLVPFSRPAEGNDVKICSPSGTASASYHHAMLVKESPLTLPDDRAWIASTVEQPQSMFLGDDLPNEEAVTRKTLLYQIRHKTRNKSVSGLPNIAPLKIGLPILPRTRLPTFPLKGAVNFRQCPGGKTGNGEGSGASGGGDWSASSISVTGSDTLSTSLVTGRGGGSGDDEDDPFNNNRLVELPRRHYAEIPQFEFDPLRDIPNLQFPDLDSLLLEGIDMCTMETLNPNRFGETRSEPIFREDVSDPAPMTPALPMTPGNPMTPSCSGPLTPSGSTYLTDSVQAMNLNPSQQHHSSTMTLPLNYGPGRSHSIAMPASDPVHGSLVSPQQAQTPEKAELEDLLDISRLLRKNPSDRSHPRPPLSSRRLSGSRRGPYTTPHSFRPSHFPHPSAARVPQQPPVPAARPVERVQSPRATRDSVHFFAVTYLVQGGRLVIGVQVDPVIPKNQQQIAYQALLHCYQLCMRYKECLDEDCDLAVAMPNKAKLCEFNFDFPKMRLSFNMPSDCLRLEKWMERYTDLDIYSRQLVVQQVLNSFVTLFQGPNQISFWGSFEVWVASNMKVYLFIDFNKALEVQKRYSMLSPGQNPRIEDCMALANLYNTVLRPYLNCDLTWASPQLGHVYLTFEDLLSDPRQCVRNLPLLARVLGERRVCKLEVTSELLLSVQYTVYCAEHEPLSSALTVLERLLPTSVCNQWAVVRALDYMPVNTTDIAARGCPHQFLIVPHPDAELQIPAALYLTSRS